MFARRRDDAIFVRNLDDSITYWNRVPRAIWWTSEQALGKGYAPLCGRFFLRRSTDHIGISQHWTLGGELVHTRRMGRRSTVARPVVAAAG